MKAGKPGAVEKLNEQLSEGIDGGPPLLDPNGSAAQALKGLGLALGVAGLPAKFGSLDEAQLQEQIKVIAETLDLTQEAGSLALQVFGKADSLQTLDKLFGKVGIGAGAVIAVADTVSALRSLSEGELGDAAVSGLNAASGVLLLIPGAQVAGVGLALASFVLSSVLADRRQAEAESASEADALEFLKDRGLEDDFAEVLSNLNDNKQNIGTFVDQVAEELGLTQDELFEKLNDSSGSDREALLEKFGQISAFGEVAGNFGDAGQFPVFGPPATGAWWGACRDAAEHGRLLPACCGPPPIGSGPPHPGKARGRCARLLHVAFPEQPQLVRYPANDRHSLSHEAS